MNYQKKILIIDGDQNFNDAIKGSLYFDQFNVFCTTNGSEGIQKAREFCPDIILCETDMVPVDGFQVFNLLKNSSNLKKTPFVFLKQNASLDDIRYGMNLGADDFISKPIEIHELLHSIKIRLQRFEFNTLELSPELVNYHLPKQICNLLRREKITLTDDLEEKIVHVIQKKKNGLKYQSNSFFTSRENQVLNLSMEGLPIKVIADKLSISARTVEKYRTKLMEKSGANNMVETIVFALKNGLIKIT